MLRDFFYKLAIKYKKPTITTISPEIPQILKKSLSLRVVDWWSDEWLVAEFNSLSSPNYSLWAYWIHITASPKHADGLVILGPVAKNMQTAILQAYEVISSPKIIIAVWKHSLDWNPQFPTTIGVKDLFPKEHIYHITWDQISAQDVFDYLVSLTK